MKTQPLPLDRIGQRFSIRLRDPEGGYRDVVGQLTSASTVIDRHGNEKSFDPNLIAYWRGNQPAIICWQRCALDASRA